MIIYRVYKDDCGNQSGQIAFYLKYENVLVVLQ